MLPSKVRSYMRTASPHHDFKDSLSAERYASTTSGMMYSLSSRSKLSRLNAGSRAFMSRITCAVSFSSNHEPIVWVTDRAVETTGFSDSSYAWRRETKDRRIGLVSFSLFHFSWRGESLCKTTAEPALSLTD